jgi:hypothetical protein
LSVNTTKYFDTKFFATKNNRRINKITQNNKFLVVAATGALTTTTTDINTNDRQNSSGNLSGVVEDQQNWSVVPVQDPQQLRRLQLLYRYGSRKIDASDLLCLYPIPEKPSEDQQTQPQKSDLQVLADALAANDARKQAEAADDAARKQAEAGQMNDEETKKLVQKAAKDAVDKALAQRGTNNPPRIRYIRGGGVNECYNESFTKEKRVPWTLVGEDPDPAFMTYPNCVLCAFPDDNQTLKAMIEKNPIIYKNRVSGTTEKYMPNYIYVPAYVHDALLSDSLNDDPINWMDVLKDGEPAPPDSRLVGSANGYSVYIHPLTPTKRGGFNAEWHFSQFVMAITDATLQSPQLQKAVAPPPLNVQTAPPLR